MKPSSSSSSSPFSSFSSLNHTDKSSIFCQVLFGSLSLNATDSPSFFRFRTQFVTTCRSTSASRRSLDRKMNQERGGFGRLIHSMPTCSSTASSNAGGCLLTSTTAAAAAATGPVNSHRVITATLPVHLINHKGAKGSTCHTLKTTVRPRG